MTSKKMVVELGFMIVNKIFTYCIYQAKLRTDVKNMIYKSL